MHTFRYIYIPIETFGAVTLCVCEKKLQIASACVSLFSFFYDVQTDLLLVIVQNKMKRKTDEENNNRQIAQQNVIQFRVQTSIRIESKYK